MVHNKRVDSQRKALIDFSTTIDNTCTEQNPHSGEDAAESPGPFRFVCAENDI